MNDAMLRLYVWQRTARWQMARWQPSRRLVRSDSGEGVISTAIAVLVMAFLGVAMWAAFSATLKKAETNVNNQVDQVGGVGPGGGG